MYWIWSLVVVPSYDIRNGFFSTGATGFGAAVFDFRGPGAGFVIATGNSSAAVAADLLRDADQAATSSRKVSRIDSAFWSVSGWSLAGSVLIGLFLSPDSVRSRHPEGCNNKLIWGLLCRVTSIGSQPIFPWLRRLFSPKSAPGHFPTLARKSYSAFPLYAA